MNGEKSSLLNLRYKAGWSCGSQTLLDTIQTKTWYHMVMTVEKETKTAKAFLNGSFVGSKNFDEFDIESSSFYINYELEHSYSNPCSVAGIRVYNRILSENELNVLNAEFSEKKIFIPLRENPGAEPQPGQTGVLLNCGGQRIFFPVLNDNVSDNGGLA